MGRFSLSTTLIINLAVTILAAVVVVVQLPALVAAVVTPRLGEDETVAFISKYLSDHDDDLDTYQRRFNGRSLFFRPLAPPRTAPIVIDQPQDGEIDPPPPAMPTTYTGPSVLFVLGDEVWFHGGLRVRVGEEDQGVKVISCDPPWTVTVAYAGGEYEVVLFERRFPGLETVPPTHQATPGIVFVDTPDNEQLEPPASGSQPADSESEEQ